jgi:RNA polymerase sigma-70 factor, ECF subfamily
MSVGSFGQSELYDELRRIAAAFLRRESALHTLQPTALVHEAYLRLMTPSADDEGPQTADLLRDRASFLGIASLVMRRVLVDHARRSRSRKRGSTLWKRIDLETDNLPTPASGLSTPMDLVELDSTLVRLGAHDPRSEKIVSMRYFGGMTVPEIAEHLALSVSTVEKDMRYALAWLARQMSR